MLNKIKNILDIYKVFDKKSKDVGDTFEMNNVIIEYKDFSEEPKATVSKMDKGERSWLYKEVGNAIKKIKNDRYTRKAIFYNLHKSELEHNCLSLFHLYFRKDELNMNVYVRSMNFDVNFDQDMYTFDIILNKACKKLNMKKGLITVFIMSLHRFT